MTMTSKSPFMMRRLFPYAESREDVLQQRVGCAAARDFLECRARLLQIGQDELFGQRPAIRRGCRARTFERPLRLPKQCDVPHVRDIRPVCRQIDVESLDEPS